MLKTIFPEEMKALETRFMARTGVKGSELMEMAAAHVADAAQRYYTGGVVVCFCGPGNNGGDGIAAMRILAGRMPQMQGRCLLLLEQLSGDAAAQLDRLHKEAPHIRVELLPAEDAYIANETEVVIDALFGTGLARPLEGKAAAACRSICGAYERGIAVIAVDIPSGLDGATGKILGTAVRATETVTFHRPKPGLYLGHGLDCSGEITVADIGIPQEEPSPEGFSESFSLLEESDLHSLLPKRPHLSHKGSYGRLLVVAGSRGMAGAAALCATAALRSGAGLVTVACPEEILPVVQTLCPCATALPLPEDDLAATKLLHDAIRKVDAVVVGCGMGKSPWAGFLLQSLVERLQNASIPAVVDADGLNLLADYSYGWGTHEPPTLPGCILTPHPAEAARLLKCTIGEILNAPAESAEKISTRYGGASVVLKGAASLLCTPEGRSLNVFGTPAMAKGGSGDVLSGIVGALLAGRAAGAYDMDDLKLMQIACAAHGLAGMAAEKRFGTRGVLATDLCEELGRVF